METLPKQGHTKLFKSRQSWGWKMGLCGWEGENLPTATNNANTRAGRILLTNMYKPGYFKKKSIQREKEVKQRKQEL